jgi:hypothetical protein
MAGRTSEYGPYPFLMMHTCASIVLLVQVFVDLSVSYTLQMAPHFNNVILRRKQGQDNLEQSRQIPHLYPIRANMGAKGDKSLPLRI